MRDGRLRGLGVTSAKRAAIAPDIPTIAEDGIAGYEASNWFGLSTRAGTPRNNVNLLRCEISRVLNLPDIKARLLTDGAEPVGSTAEEFDTYIRAEKVKWAKVVTDAGIQPE